MKAKTLVQSWLEVELIHNQKRRVDVLNDMNRKLGKAHTHGRLREWEENRAGRGNKLPRKQRLYMAKIAIKSVLAESGVDVSSLSKRQLNKIVEQLQ